MIWGVVECYNNILKGINFHQIQSFDTSNKPVPIFFLTGSKIVGSYYLGTEPVSRNHLFLINRSDKDIMTGDQPISICKSGLAYHNLLFKYLGEGENILYGQQYNVDTINNLFPIAYPSGTPSATLTLTPTTLNLTAGIYNYATINGTLELTNSRTSTVLTWQSINIDKDAPPFTVDPDFSTNHLYISNGSSGDLSSFIQYGLKLDNFLFKNLEMTGSANSPTGFNVDFSFDVINYSLTGTAFSTTIDLQTYVSSGTSISLVGPETITINLA